MLRSLLHHQTKRIKRLRSLGKSTIAMVALFLMTCATPIWGQHPVEPLATFTAPDDAFTFRHSNQLILCQAARQKGCRAYWPVCDDGLGQDQTSIVCFAYPRNKFTNTKAFEAATFSVEVINQGATEKDCLAGPSDASNASKQKQPPALIHGVSFAVFAFSDGGMNQAVNGHVYRAFHRGKCYQLGINVATANADVFDPPARNLTKDDLREVNRQLQQGPDSFQFLK